MINYAHPFHQKFTPTGPLPRCIRQRKYYHPKHELKIPIFSKGREDFPEKMRNIHASDMANGVVGGGAITGDCILRPGGPAVLSTAWIHIEIPILLPQTRLNFLQSAHCILNTNSKQMMNSPKLQSIEKEIKDNRVMNKSNHIAP